MSDSLRIRLEFRQFNKKSYRNSLLSFRRSETKDVQCLEALIRQRFAIEEPFCLNIDSFVLQQTEPIDILRDNDLIVVEPKTNIICETEMKKEKVSQQFDYISNALHFSESLKNKTNKKKSNVYKSEKYVIDSDESSSGVNTNSYIKPKSVKKHKSDNNMKPNVRICDIKTEMESSEESNSLDMNLFSSRNTPMRRAFQLATNSIKKRPNIAIKAERSNSAKNQTKKKRLTQEARDPVDEFSPIIILEKLMPKSVPNVRQSNHLDINGKPLVKKQSARKSFPSPQLSIDNTNGITSDGTENANTLKTIDCSKCEPLCGIPLMGDIIAFKMLTLSKDGKRYETSSFNKGSVLNVNEDNCMVDILLYNSIRRTSHTNGNHSNDIKEQINGIHALKINWSTVLEPKLIQRSQPLKVDEPLASQ